MRKDADAAESELTSTLQRDHNRVHSEALKTKKKNYELPMFLGSKLK